MLSTIHKKNSHTVETINNTASSHPLKYNDMTLVHGYFYTMNQLITGITVL